MAKMLLRDLNDQDRSALSNLTLQPGWPIVVKMMQEMCEIATSAVIQCDPGDANYVGKLRSLQGIARATNDFCSSLLKSIDAHSTLHLRELQNEEDVTAMLAKARQPQQQQIDN